MTVPEAIDVAKEHLALVLPEYATTAVHLEELETPPFGSKWRFTFSMNLLTQGADLSLGQLVRSRRVSKSVEIDPQTGDLLAVKNAAV